MNHIFVSYSRKDQEKAEAVVKQLRFSGIEIWQDVSGDRSGIPYSVKWFEAIEEAIFTSSGAIILKSEAWENSVPCFQEYQLILDTRLPFMYIDAEDFWPNEKLVIEQAVNWCEQQISAEENGLCRWMLSGAHRLYRGLPVEIYFPKGRHFFRNWKWIKQCYVILNKEQFREPWLEIAASFLERAKKKVLFDMVKKIAISVFTIAIGIIGLSYWRGIERARELNTSHATGAALTNIARRLGRYDPLSAMDVMDDFGPQGIYVEEDYDGNYSDYAAGNRILAELVSRNYPSEFYESISECPVDISGITENQSNDRFTVTLADQTSQVFIYDRECDTTSQFTLDMVPRMYCFNEAGNLLLTATENKVYIYDLYGDAEPFLLSHNYENIRSISMYEDKIYAVTENDHVIVWNNPILERKITDREISTGQIVCMADGREIAVYVDQSSLILNLDNKETIYPLSFQGTIRNYMEVSENGTYAAVVYSPDDGGSDRIAMINLSNGLLEREYDTGCRTANFIISEDGTSFIVTCYDKFSIERIDIETGAIQESTGNTFTYPYTLIEYGDRFLVCDNLGVLTVYDHALRQVGDYRSVCEFRIPQRQLAVSPKYDCLFMASRSGNLSIGNYMVHLSSDEQDFIPPAEGETMAATTSVTVTEDGDYVAFGNPDGSIYLWDIGTVNQVWNVQGISETIIDMSFSGDLLILYALGSSGTIYPIDLSEVLPEITPANSSSICKMLKTKSTDIKKKMILLDIPVIFD